MTHPCLFLQISFFTPGFPPCKLWQKVVWLRRNQRPRQRACDINQWNKKYTYSSFLKHYSVIPTNSAAFCVSRWNTSIFCLFVVVLEIVNIQKFWHWIISIAYLIKRQLKNWILTKLLFSCMFQIKVEPCTCSKPVLGVNPKAFAPLSRPIKSHTKTFRPG